MKELKLINIKKLNDISFKVDDKLGVMRLDWQDRNMCNKWFPSQHFFDLCKANEVDIHLLQEEINKLMFDQLNLFSRIIDLCKGESYQNECTFKVEGVEVIYYVKLIPVRAATSAIMVYIK